MGTVVGHSRVQAIRVQGLGFRVRGSRFRRLEARFRLSCWVDRWDKYVLRFCVCLLLCQVEGPTALKAQGPTLLRN